MNRRSLRLACSGGDKLGLGGNGYSGVWWICLSSGIFENKGGLEAVPPMAFGCPVFAFVCTTVFKSGCFTILKTSFVRLPEFLIEIPE